MNVEILKQLEEIIHDYKGSKDLQISEDSSLIRDLELSSLDIINLVGRLSISPEWDKHYQEK